MSLFAPSLPLKLFAMFLKRKTLDGASIAFEPDRGMLSQILKDFFM
jgi:hypothetical protein